MTPKTVKKVYLQRFNFLDSLSDFSKTDSLMKLKEKFRDP